MQLASEHGVSRSRVAREASNSVASLRLYDGALRTLEDLTDRETSMGVVTNLPGWLVTPLVQATGIAGYFAAIVTPRAGVPAKPKPHGILRALQEMGREGDVHTWMVGDGVADAAAAEGGWCAFRLGVLRIRNGNTGARGDGTAPFRGRAWSMKFLYKIHSGYDGFRPAVIPQRMETGTTPTRMAPLHRYSGERLGVLGLLPRAASFRKRRLREGYRGPDVDLAAGEVSLRVREHGTERPITPCEISRRVANVVAPRYRQVFVWPEQWTVEPECGLAACKSRQCDDCATWAGLPLIKVGHARAPRRLRWTRYDDVVSAHWIVPSRCYETRIAAAVLKATRRFYDFKLGELAYAYPFARSMFEQLRRRELLDFDCVVPIPLSPDKAQNWGETPDARVGQGTRQAVGGADARHSATRGQGIEAKNASRGVHDHRVRTQVLQCASRRGFAGCGESASC